MKQWWRKWTHDIPLRISDALWEVLVVQFAAWLDRLTLRRIIAFIPAVVLILAYAHNIPIPPELMLVGDALAYIDIFSVILLLGLLSRVTTIVFVVRDATARGLALTGRLRAGLMRLDLRHRRESGTRRRARGSNQTRTDDDGCADIATGDIIGTYRLKPEGRRFGIRAAAPAVTSGRIVLASGRRHSFLYTMAAFGPGRPVLA